MEYFTSFKEDKSIRKTEYCTKQSSSWWSQTNYL